MLPLRERDYELGEAISHWQIPASWWENHDSSDLHYRVRLRVDDSEALNAAWRLLSTRYTAHDAELWIGGAYLRRTAPETVEAVSGGEDALDSLEWAINEDLIAAVREVSTDERVNICSIEERRIPSL